MPMDPQQALEMAGLQRVFQLLWTNSMENCRRAVLLQQTWTYFEEVASSCQRKDSTACLDLEERCLDVARILSRIPEADRYRQMLLLLDLS